jgi:threonine dehydrogenase-like Zn-dependent dehydrogenase
MRGYVIQEKGRAGWQDVPVPQIGPYDALVRPTAVATCTTDVHLIDSLSLPKQDRGHRRDIAGPSRRIQPGFARRIPGRQEQAAR